MILPSNLVRTASCPRMSGVSWFLDLAQFSLTLNTVFEGISEIVLAMFQIFVGNGDDGGVGREVVLACDHFLLSSRLPLQQSSMNCHSLK